MAYSTSTPFLVGAIDQGTTSTRFMVFDQDLKVVAFHQLEHNQIFPKPGWTEHDPLEIIQRTHECIKQVLSSGSLSASDIKAIGITNQRETTVVWDSLSGKPLYNAIVWNDTRTATLVHQTKDSIGDESVQQIRAKTGLPISTYFSALKLRWIIDNVPAVRQAIAEERCMAGTIDAWLIWNLTGGAQGGRHVTDVTNASRTLLMNLETLQWDPSLLSAFGIDSKLKLPTIMNNSDRFGVTKSGTVAVEEPLTYEGIPITGCIGDQQSATVGQRCFLPGQCKNTYGTGCFMLMNTGHEIVKSKHGLLSTVCYQFGEGKPYYALEGSIAVAGSAVQWLRDNIGLIKKSSEIEDLSRQVTNSGGVYFVPAFGGLFAPRWRDDARGVLIGMTHYTNKSHIARALLEATAFQTREVLEAMVRDSDNISVDELKVDGGMTANFTFLQMQADVLGIPIVKPPNQETTAIGAAISAAIGAGLMTVDTIPKPSLPANAEPPRFHDDMKARVREDGFIVFEPTITEEERNRHFAGWTQAVERSYDLKEFTRT